MSDTKANEQAGWQSFVLLPADDVPRTGSRTEIVVTPKRCLRVQVRETKDGRLEFRRAG